MNENNVEHNGKLAKSNMNMIKERSECYLSFYIIIIFIYGEINFTALCVGVTQDQIAAESMDRSW